MLKMRKMKDSGIEWIGEIPEGWEVAPVKRLCTMQAGKNLTSEQIAPEGIYPVYGGNGIRGFFSDYNCDGQFLTVGRQGALCGNVHKINGKVWATEHAVITTPSSYTTLDFLYYLLIGMDLNQYVSSTAAQPGLAVGTLLNLKTCYPCSTLEQTQISNYLNAKCSEIDVMLTKTRSSIEEYKKLKQAVITQAVTKGVRSKREMKDSGVEWIGEIPVEWRKTQLRHCATIKSGITLGKSYSKDTVLIERPYLRVANVQGGYVDLNDLATIEVPPDEDLKYRLHSGDVLMTEGGDRDKLGRGCVWHGEIEPCLHQNHVFAVQTNETILLPEFLEYLTASDVGRSYFDVTAIKTTNLACTSSSKVLAFTIPLPPIEEQIEIVNFIKKRSLELNKLIMKKELLVQELESYKKSLIYEVVTGKREV